MNKQQERIKIENITNFKDGVNNWVKIFLFSSILSFVLSNYTEYGIIHSPLDLITFLLNFVYRTKWLYVAILLGIYWQVCLAIIIEKYLLRKIISEYFGQILQLCNALLVLNIIAFSSIYYNINSFAASYLTGINFLFVFKFWSFAEVNRSTRLKYFKDTSTVNGVYPKNLTKLHLFKYIIGSGSLIYTLEQPKKNSRNYVKIAIKILTIIVLKFISSFIVYQYILPYLDEIIVYIDNGEYLKVAQTYLQLMLPIYGFFMLIFQYFIFNLYYPLLTEICGFESVIQMKDWWNTNCLAHFWTHWNIQTHYFFKIHVVKPMLDRGFTKMQAHFLVLLISGLLHEYFIGTAFRTCYGLTTFGMVSQIPLFYVTKKVQERFGCNIGNIYTLVLIQFGKVCIVVLIYYFYVKNLNKSYTW